MFFPDRKIVERIKKEYPSGTRVELVELNDPYRHPRLDFKEPSAVSMILEQSMWTGTTAATLGWSTAKTDAGKSETPTGDTHHNLHNYRCVSLVDICLRYDLLFRR